jgi:hypothetical protein
MFDDHPTIALDPIPDFPGYFACRLGIIFSVNQRGARYPKPLRPGSYRGGYHHVILCRYGERFARKVHHLILETYVGPKPKGMVSRHINNTRTDNRLSNLCWGTPAENGRDTAISGTLKGTNHPQSKLTDDDIRAIRTMTAQEAAERYPITTGNAYFIIGRKTWKHVL